MTACSLSTIVQPDDNCLLDVGEMDEHYDRV